ncbi:MAG: hypothetical protein ACXAD7_06450, partial [Candidatus Kariarchaeaceae archaeon]
EEQIERVLKIAKLRSLTTLQIDTLLLQAKFDLLKGRFTLATDRLEIAFEIAVSKDLKLYVNKIAIEQEYITNNINQMKFALDGLPIKSQLQELQLHDYLKSVSKVLSRSVDI